MDRLRRLQLWTARCALMMLGLAVVHAPAALADQGLTYSPSPAFAGSIEQFSACGFKDGEKVDLLMDGSPLAQSVASGGCVSIAQQTALDIQPANHPISAKGETSSGQQDGILVVMPPLLTSPPAIVIAGYGNVLVTGQFFPPGATLTGAFPPVVFGSSGDFFAQIFVPPGTAPGSYPMLFQDVQDPADPALAKLPPIIISVLPEPSASASAQPASGHWTLTATSTLTRNDATLTANGSSKAVAQLQSTGGQVKGQGQLAVAMDMKVQGSGCHGESAPVPFTVGGTQDGTGLHLTLSGTNSTFNITVTCDNGLSLPFSLPGGGSTASPFDIPAVDGQTIDLTSSNQFVTVPPGFSGHTHVVLNQS